MVDAELDGTAQQRDRRAAVVTQPGQLARAVADAGDLASGERRGTTGMTSIGHARESPPMIAPPPTRTARIARVAVTSGTGTADSRIAATESRAAS